MVFRFFNSHIRNVLAYPTVEKIRKSNIRQIVNNFRLSCLFQKWSFHMWKSIFFKEFVFGHYAQHVCYLGVLNNI